jgi:hypothetical protein
MAITLNEKPEEFRAVQFDGTNYDEVKTFITNIDYFSFVLGVAESPDPSGGLGTDPVMVFKPGRDDTVTGGGFYALPQGWWVIYGSNGWTLAPNLDEYVQVT